MNDKDKENLFRLIEGIFCLMGPLMGELKDSSRIQYAEEMEKLAKNRADHYRRIGKDKN